MNEFSFLSKLKKKKSLSLVEPSEEISEAYMIKSDKCSQVAKLACDAGIYENAVSEAYYSIYNSVLSLFFKCGIKCENHSGAVILIGCVFGLRELNLIFSEFKKDRIDNQYYVPIKGTEAIDAKKCKERILTAQKFTANIMAYKSNLKIKEISNIRKRFEEI